MPILPSDVSEGSVIPTAITLERSAPTSMFTISGTMSSMLNLQRHQQSSSTMLLWPNPLFTLVLARSSPLPSLPSISSHENGGRLQQGSRFNCIDRSDKHRPGQTWSELEIGGTKSVINKPVNPGQHSSVSDDATTLHGLNSTSQMDAACATIILFDVEKGDGEKRQQQQ
jgi:hypothetical protein